jgi:hypothetical protein
MKIITFQTINIFYVEKRKIFCLLVCSGKNIKIRLYKVITLPVVLYWYETWSLTMREEYKLEVFENRVLMRIYGPKRNGVTGE